MTFEQQPMMSPKSFRVQYLQRYDGLSQQLVDVYSIRVYTNEHSLQNYAHVVTYKYAHFITYHVLKNCDKFQSLNKDNMAKGLTK